MDQNQPKSKWWAPVALVVVLVLIVVGLVLWQKNKAPKETIKIGANLTLTGAGSLYGNDYKDGLLLAEKEFEKNKNLVDIVIEDNKTNAAESVTVYNKLKNIDNADLILSLTSPTTVPLASLSDNDQLPLFVTLTSATNIAKDHKFLFQYYLRAEDYAHPIAEAVKDKEIKKVAVLTSQDDFGQSVMSAFKSKFESEGGQIPLTLNFANTETDFRTILAKVKESNVEAIVFGGFAPNYINILKNRQEMGITQPFFEMSPNTMYLSIVSQTEGTAEGVYALGLESVVNMKQDFQTKFKDEYGRDATAAAALAYDSLDILLNKAKIDGAMSGQEIVDKIKAIGGYSGLNGKVTLNSDREYIFPTHLITIKDNKIIKAE